jgi:hypothetical protein
MGKTRHGFAWQDAAYGIETAAAALRYLNLPLNIGRRDTLCRNLVKCKGNMEIGLLLWGMWSHEITFRDGE